MEVENGSRNDTFAKGCVCRSDIGFMNLKTLFENLKINYLFDIHLQPPNTFQIIHYSLCLRRPNASQIQNNFYPKPWIKNKKKVQIGNRISLESPAAIATLARDPSIDCTFYQRKASIAISSDDAYQSTQWCAQYV
jgi:hypothetical protein